MKKRWKILMLTLMFLALVPINSMANEPEDEVNQEEILNMQQESLNISGFLKETQKYTQDTFEDIDLNDLLTHAITGNIDNKTFLKAIGNIARERNCRMY